MLLRDCGITLRHSVQRGVTARSLSFSACGPTSSRVAAGRSSAWEFRGNSVRAGCWVAACWLRGPFRRCFRLAVAVGFLRRISSSGSVYGNSSTGGCSSVRAAGFLGFSPGAGRSAVGRLRSQDLYVHTLKWVSALGQFER